MSSIKRPSPDAELPGPAPRRRRVVGHNACRRCKNSKIACRRTEPGPCTNCQQRGFECEQAQEDSRTNHAASCLLAEKIAYLEEICSDYLFLFQILCSDDPMDADIRGTVAEKALGECPNSIVPVLRREGYSEVRVGYRPAFVPAVSADDAFTLSDRRRVETTFRQDSLKYVDQLEAVLECVAVGICPDSERDIVLAASRTGHHLQEAINGIIAYLKASLPWMLEPPAFVTAHYRKVLEEPRLSVFRTLRVKTPPLAIPPPPAPSPLAPAAPPVDAIQGEDQQGVRLAGFLENLAERPAQQLVEQPEPPVQQPVMGKGPTDPPLMGEANNSFLADIWPGTLMRHPGYPFGL